MGCTTCMAKYTYLDLVATNGGRVVIAEGVVPQNRHHTLGIPEGFNKDTRSNIMGIAQGTLRYDEYPEGFTPILLTEGMTSNEIPPYPAGIYSLIADEHCAFYCITAADGVARPRGVHDLQPGDVRVLKRGTAAVLLTGAIVSKGESLTGPQIIVARRGAFQFRCTVAGRMTYMEEAVGE